MSTVLAIPSRAQVGQVLPKPNLIAKDYKRFGDTSDIMQAVYAQDAQSLQQGAKIARFFFRGRDVHESADNIAAFLAANVKYKADKPEAQVIKTPAALISTGTGDCKSFSVFTRSVLAGLGIESGYRFVSYDNGDFTHVYNVYKDKAGKVYTLDTVVNNSRQEMPYSKKKDVFMTHVYTMNGPRVVVDDTPPASFPDEGPAIVVDPRAPLTVPIPSNKRSWLYATLTGDYLPYLQWGNAFWAEFWPILENEMRGGRGSTLNRQDRKVLGAAVAFWLHETWKNSEFREALAIGINNIEYANHRKAAGTWTEADQRATVAAYPKFIEYVKLADRFENTFGQWLIMKGIAPARVDRFTMAELLRFYVFAANHNAGRVNFVVNETNTRAAIGEPVTVIVAIAAALGSIAAIADAISKAKKDLTDEGIDVAALEKQAGRLYQNYLNKQNQTPGGGGGGGGSAPGGGGSPGGMPILLPGTPSGGSMLPLLIGAGLVAFFIFKK